MQSKTNFFTYTQHAVFKTNNFLYDLWIDANPYEINGLELSSLTYLIKLKNLRFIFIVYIYIQRVIFRTDNFYTTRESIQMHTKVTGYCWKT